MFVRACRTTLKRTSRATATARLTVTFRPQRFFASEPTAEEQSATDARKDEIAGALKGPQMHSVMAADMYEGRGNNKLPLVGDFGTLQNPCYVPSTYNSRIVGCTGGGPAGRHELVWMDIRMGPKHACKECGQIFQLAPWMEKDMEDLDAEVDPKDL